MIREQINSAGTDATTIKLQSAAVILLGLACKVLLDFSLVRDDGEAGLQDALHVAATLLVFLAMAVALWTVSRPLAQEAEPETLHFPPPRRPLVIGLMTYVFFSDFVAQLLADRIGTSAAGGNIAKFVTGFALAFAVAALLTPLNARDAARNIAMRERARNRIEDHVY